MISFGPLKADTELPGLLALSATQFGPDGYQHLPRYIEWLYRARPSTRGPSDCLVARRDGMIVGAMHRMMLPLIGSGTLGVLHNHFMADTVRSGPGALLLRRAIKDVRFGFAPGVQAPLDQVYRQLGFTEQPGFWLMRALAPVRGGLQLVRARLRRRGAMRIDLARLSLPAGVTVTHRPSPEQLASLCAAMRIVRPGLAAVDWTPELVRWRYFDALGPRHLLVSGGDGQAVAALGIRRGLTVARLLELHAPAGFVGPVERVMKAAGAVLGLSFTTEQGTVTALQNAGWRLRHDGTFSFRSGNMPIALGAGATDVGFEAFNTEFVA